MPKTTLFLPADTAKMARALDQLATEQLSFISETVGVLGAPQLDTETVTVRKEAGELALRIAEMTPEDRNVLKGLVARFMSRAKERKRR